MTTDERFDRLDASIERLNDSVGEIKSSIAQLRDYSAQLTISVEHVTQYLLDFRQEAIQHLEVIDGRLDVLTATITTIDARFPPFTKGLLDFGKISTQLTNDQAR